MPIFKCTQCGCVENTACCNYWMTKDYNHVLCSACDPKIGKWHDMFPRINADEKGYVADSEGFLRLGEEEV